MDTVRDDKPAGDRPFLLGRIVEPGPPNPASLRGYVATAGCGGRTFDRTTSDSTGRFLLEFDPDVLRGREFLDVFVTSATGARVGAKRSNVIDLASPQVLLFQTNDAPTMLSPREPSTLIKRFVANNESTIVVDSSCSSAILEWTVGSVVDDASGIRVVLAEDGRPIARDLPAQGNYSVKNRTTAVYTLSVRARSGSEVPLDSQTLTVKRLPTLTVYFEDIPLKANTQIPFGVMISCPAPERGLMVILVSSDPTKVNGGEVQISPGGTWASTALFCGVGTGDVEVTGIATGYLRDTVHLVVRADQSEPETRAKWK